MNLTTRQGLVWPASDRECHPVVFSSLSDLDIAVSLCAGRALAVQAGGNCGVWPRHLAGLFRTVWTFEPDPVNLHCLKQNVPGNVRYRGAALGEKKGRSGMARKPANIGAHYLTQGEDVPVITLDSLRLPACDLLALDVEGFELPALRGAAATIRDYRPVIMIEDKGLSEKYGVRKGEAVDWIVETFGYRVAHRPRRDVIMVPE